MSIFMNRGVLINSCHSNALCSFETFCTMPGAGFKPLKFSTLTKDCTLPCPLVRQDPILSLVALHAALLAKFTKQCRCFGLSSSKESM